MHLKNNSYHQKAYEELHIRHYYGYLRLSKISTFLSMISFYRKFMKNLLAGAYKKFYRIRHPELYLLDLKVLYKHKIELPFDTVSKRVLLHLCLPD